MEAIQEELKRRREERGLSLEELSGETNIAVRYLKAIEEGDFGVLPRPYIRMFLKAYGVRVGMDAESVLRRFDEMMTPEEERVRKRVGGPSARSVFPKRRLAIAGGVLGIIVVIFIIVWFLEASREMSLERAQTEDVRPIPDTETSEQSVEGERGEGDSVRTTEADPALEGEALVSLTEPSEEPGNPVAADSLLVLEGEAREETWLAVQADGGPEERRTMKSGERGRWEARDRFEVTLGKPRGIALTFQGKVVEDTAWHRVPIHLMFSRDGVEIVKKVRRPGGAPALADSTMSNEE